MLRLTRVAHGVVETRVAQAVTARQHPLLLLLLLVVVLVVLCCSCCDARAAAPDTGHHHFQTCTTVSGSMSNPLSKISCVASHTFDTPGQQSHGLCLYPT